MSLLRFPPEIIQCVIDFLDLKDTLKLLAINSHFRSLRFAIKKPCKVKVSRLNELSKLFLLPDKLTIDLEASRNEHLKQLENFISQRSSNTRLLQNPETTEDNLQNSKKSIRIFLNDVLRIKELLLLIQGYEEIHLFLKKLNFWIFRDLNTKRLYITLSDKNITNTYLTFLDKLEKICLYNEFVSLLELSDTEGVTILKDLSKGHELCIEKVFIETREIKELTFFEYPASLLFVENKTFFHLRKHNELYLFALKIETLTISFISSIVLYSKSLKIKNLKLYNNIENARIGFVSGKSFMEISEVHLKTYSKKILLLFGNNVKIHKFYIYSSNNTILNIQGNQESIGEMIRVPISENF